MPLRFARPRPMMRPAMGGASGMMGRPGMAPRAMAASTLPPTAANGGAPSPQAGNRGGVSPFNPQGPLQSGGPMAAPPPNTMSAFTPQNLLNSYNNAYTQAQQANSQRYNDILGGYGNLQQQAGNAYGDLSNNVMGNLQGNDQAINQGYQDRYTRNMGYLNDAGVQAKADLNQNYNSLGAQTQQNLTNAGLAGTTIAPTMQAGVNTQRNADMNRLNASLNQQRIGYDSQLSGDQLAAKTGQANYMAGLGSSLGQAGIGMQTGLGQNQLNFQERRNDPYPNLDSLSNTMIGLGRAGYGAGGAGGAYGNMGGLGGGGSGGGVSAGAAKKPVTYQDYMNAPNSAYNADGGMNWEQFQAQQGYI